jgi:hypothetical protein
MGIQSLPYLAAFPSWERMARREEIWPKNHRPVRLAS